MPPKSLILRILEDFQEKRGHRIIGIDTFPRSRFKNDQHFTREADEAIALDALNRVEFLQIAE